MVPVTLVPVQLVTLVKTVKSLRVLRSHVLTVAHVLSPTATLFAHVLLVILEQRVKQRLAHLVPVLMVEVVQFRVLGMNAPVLQVIPVMNAKRHRAMLSHVKTAESKFCLALLVVVLVRLDTVVPVAK